MDIIKKICRSFGIILGYVFFNLLINSILFAIIDSYIFIVITPFIIGLALYFIFKKDIILNFKNFKFSYILKNFKYYLLGFVLMILFNYILINIFGVIATNEDLNRKLISDYPGYSLIAMILLVPITEELCFRLNIRKAINNKYIYIVVSGLLFGFMHVLGDNILYILPYATLGICFAITYYNSKNILVPIIFHIFHNALTICVILFGGLL